MRLLNVRSGKVEEFASDEQERLPRYAILSHTWGPEEISLADWTSLPKQALRVKQGYFKIKYLRYQAIQDGLEWVWIDTCCIDRRSSAEVEEAVNAMFRWYANAAVCYAYLDDIAQPVLGASLADALRQSHWFTRGWTLQELIAPPDVVFYSTGWDQLGSKVALADVIAEFTGIDTRVLHSRTCSPAESGVSVARMLSWAAGRRTTRPEDVAYSLLGLFDVHMPLMYGEGRKRAFWRLQEHIIRAFPTDHTLFAWGDRIIEQRPDVISHGVLMDESDSLRWVADTPPLRGLLADSPEDFRNSTDLVPISVAAELFYYGSEYGSGGRGDAEGGENHHQPGCAAPPAPTARGGVVVELPLLEPEAVAYHWRGPKVTQMRWGRLAVLFCHRKGNPYEQLAVALTPTGPASHGRGRELISGNFHQHIWQTAPSPGPSRILVAPEMGTSSARLLGHGDLVVRRWIVGSNEDLLTGEFRDARGHAYSPREALLRVNGEAEGALLWSMSALNESETLCIFIKRARPRPSTSSGSGSISNAGGLGPPPTPAAANNGGARNSASGLFSGIAESISSFAAAAGAGSGGNGSVRNSASSVLSGITGLGGASGAVATDGNPAISISHSPERPSTSASASTATTLGSCSIELWPLSRKVHGKETVDAHGTTWFPHGENEDEVLELAQRSDPPPLHYVFKPGGSDTWIAPAIGAALPMLTARMDRMRLEDGVEVDVVDVVAPHAAGTPLTQQTPRMGRAPARFTFGNF